MRSGRSPVDGEPQGHRASIAKSRVLFLTLPVSTRSLIPSTPAAVVNSDGEYLNMSTDAQSTLLGDGHSDLGGGSQPPPVAISHSLTATVDRKPASHGEEQPFATTAGGDAVLDQQGSGRGSSPSANSSAPDTNHGHHPAQSAQLIVPSSIHQPSTSTASCTTQPASQDTVQASQAALERRGSNRRSTIDVCDIPQRVHLTR